MLETTRDAIRAILKSDPSLGLEDRHRIVQALRNNCKAPEEEKQVAPESRLIRRAEVARRMSVSLRAVDNWTKAGILQKVKLPGRVRHSGFRESDIESLIKEGRCL